MQDEYNLQDTPEYGELPAEEYNYHTDNPQPQDNAQHSGSNSVPGEHNEKADVKKGKSIRKRAIAFFSSAIAVAILGGAMILPKASVNAEIVETWVSDTEIGYTVTVTSTKKPLKVIVYNDFTRREATLEIGENQGVFEGLKPNMSYTVAIEGNFGFGSSKVIKCKVRTEKGE